MIVANANADVGSKLLDFIQNFVSKNEQVLFTFNVDNIKVDDDALKDLIKWRLKQGCDQYFQS